MAKAICSQCIHGNVSGYGSLCVCFVKWGRGRWPPSMEAGWGVNVGDVTAAIQGATTAGAVDSLNAIMAM